MRPNCPARRVALPASRGYPGDACETYSPVERGRIGDAFGFDAGRFGRPLQDEGATTRRGHNIW